MFIREISQMQKTYCTVDWLQELSSKSDVMEFAISCDREEELTSTCKHNLLKRQWLKQSNSNRTRKGTNNQTLSKNLYGELWMVSVIVILISKEKVDKLKYIWIENKMPHYQITHYIYIRKTSLLHSWKTPNNHHEKTIKHCLVEDHKKNLQRLG